jgi:hypothetical protein
MALSALASLVTDEPLVNVIESPMHFAKSFANVKLSLAVAN